MKLATVASARSLRSTSTPQARRPDESFNVSTRWLHDNLTAPWLRIIDVRSAFGVTRTSTLRGEGDDADESGVLPRSADVDVDPPRFVEIGPHAGWLRAGDWPKAAHSSSPPFLRGHIPGSAALDVARLFFDSSGSLVWAPELAMVMSTLGVGDDHTIVLVDENCPSAALVAAWALRHHGHAETFILSGGFPRWLAERKPVSREIVKHAFASFTARLS